MLATSPAGGETKFDTRTSQESYGTVAVFEDLYGNNADLLQMKLRADG